jgi:excisionase family DNA binding protein
MNAITVPALLTMQEAADRLNISTKLLRAEVRARRLRFILVGKRRRFTPQDLEDYIAGQRQEYAPKPANAKPRGRAVVYDITPRLVSRSNKRQI